MLLAPLVPMSHTLCTCGECSAGKYYSFFLPCFVLVDAKRLIGRRFDDATVTSDRKHWPFEVISDGSKPKIQVESKGEKKTFYPEEVSNSLLHLLLSDFDFVVKF